MSDVMPRVARATALIVGTAVLSVAAAGAGATPAGATTAGDAAPRSDSAAVADVLDRFHTALAEGDTATVLALLAPDATVLESGGIETRDEYRGHHLPADMAFARAVEREREPVHVRVQGDVAWATSSSIARGTFRDRAIDTRTAELAVLVRTPDGWRITAIHWSSRNRSG